MSVNIKLRRGTSTQWTAADPVLKNGEIIVESDTKNIKIGDGATSYTALPYGGTLGPAGYSGTDAVPAGGLSYMPTNTAPTGWVAADGGNVSMTLHPNLSPYLLSSVSGMMAPVSITTAGLYPANWQPTTNIFNTSRDNYTLGGYLSQYVYSGSEFEAFDITFESPTTITAICLFNPGAGQPPSYWKIMALPSGAPQIFVADSGPHTTNGGNIGVTDSWVATNFNWYNITTSVVAQTYRITLSQDSGSYSDLGVMRMYFQTLSAAPSGFKLAPSIAPIVPSTAGAQTLYAYIKD